MKKTFILVASLIFSCTALFAQPQGNPMMQSMPNDPAMKIGKLENGLTYYIMKNNKPANTANFHIVTHVGAAQETDPQNGLAHFLEHMAFNGISIFPNEKMLEYLQNNGIEFGRNINASTGLDVTQYFLQDIPLNKTQGLVDTALLILRDWSSNILLQNEEVDAERGVISEEHRTTETSQKKLRVGRVNNAARGTNYSKRNVIGSLENLAKFKYSDIKEFYQTWYRPSLQAIIIVGDFDVTKMESEVKRVFNAIPSRENEVPKETIIIPAYEETYAQIFVDKELTSSDFWALALIDQNQFKANNQFGSEVKRYMFSLINSILNKRLEAIAQNPDAPFIFSYHTNRDIIQNNQMEMAAAGLKDGRELEAIELVAKEINRMKKHGVNNSELRIAIQNLIKANETAYNNRYDRTNTQIALNALSNFTTNSPFLAPEFDYNFAMQLLSTLTIDAVNPFIPMLIKDDNKYFLSIGTPKATVTTEEIIAAFDKGMKLDVEPIAEKIIDSNILDEKTLTKGSVVKTEAGEYESTVWTLSNGAKIVFKPTELKKDEFMFSAKRDGGLSLFENNEIVGATMANMFYSNQVGGVGKYSKMDLNDALSGKNAFVSLGIAPYNTYISGQSSSNDIETLFKLINLNLSQPRFVEEDMKTLQAAYAPMYKNWKNDPKTVFRNEFTKAISPSDSERTDLVSYESLSMNLDKMTVENCEKTFAKAFDGVNGMTFVFIGNAKAEDIKKYAELYIGSLAAGSEPEKINRTTYKTDDFGKNITFKQENDKASVGMIFTMKGKNTLRDDLIYGMLANVLDYRYTEVIREKMGATYGVGVAFNSSNTPAGFERYLFVQYDTNDKHIKNSSAEVLNQVELIAKNGPSHEDFMKSIESRKKNFINNQINNSFWHSALLLKYTENKETVNAFNKTIDSISEKDIQKAAKTLLKKSVETKVIMSSNELK